VTGDARHALGRHRQRGEDADRGRLARTVVAEQTEHGAGLDVEREIPKRPEIAEAFAETRGEDAALAAEVGNDMRGAGGGAQRSLIRIAYAFLVHSTKNLTVHCTNGK